MLDARGRGGGDIIVFKGNSFSWEDEKVLGKKRGFPLWLSGNKPD